MAVDLQCERRTRITSDADHPIAMQLLYGLPAVPVFTNVFPNRYLHSHQDSYPAETTFVGAGLAPAGTANLCTAHVDQRTQSSHDCSDLGRDTDLACRRVQLDAQHGVAGNCSSRDSHGVTVEDPSAVFENA